ncbi:MAG: NAD(P)-dependent oxidoreductase, partial [Actinobacteria bacterium]|nr:NAD(P)-dependent oxidoreductase [Actinomycetota bacterium]NIU70806.1 NAD(P)-dependent oxidoreductase [Actinomycetota bacterium]NIV90373.1 NAD(P)-dependent oxidoreductase [Actinomycetota bacterium]NIW32729.1 NAD(P)-dependent oxidoreductase [Actinomycetota bacterium]NIX24910.1 NAD(P)-dependent oxidoreductase [Actinomycetota bacterium]
LIHRVSSAREAGMLPLGLAPGSVLRKPVARGQTLTYDDVELDESLTIVHLRRLQDLETG